jgi:hypothetical protein
MLFHTALMVLFSYALQWRRQIIVSACAENRIQIFRTELRRHSNDNTFRYSLISHFFPPLLQVIDADYLSGCKPPSGSYVLSPLVWFVCFACSHEEGAFTVFPETLPKYKYNTVFSIEVLKNFPSTGFCNLKCLVFSLHAVVLRFAFATRSLTPSW